VTNRGLEILPCFDLHKWNSLVSTKDGYLVVLDMNEAAIKIISLNFISKVASGEEECNRGGIARKVDLGSEFLFTPAIGTFDPQGERLYVSHFSGNVIQVFRWVTDANSVPNLILEQRYEFSNGGKKGLSGIVVVDDALYVADKSWDCIGKLECDYSQPMIHVIEKISSSSKSKKSFDLFPSTVNTLGFYQHLPSGSLYFLNGGDKGNASSIQKILDSHSLGKEIKFPANANIGRTTISLNARYFAVLQLSGDHIFIIDVVTDQLVSISYFDGKGFIQISPETNKLRERNFASIYSMTPDPNVSNTWLLMDSKNEQLVKVYYDSTTQKFISLDQVSLSNSESSLFPSWSFWLNSYGISQ